MQSFKRHLKRLNACAEAIAWVGARDLPTAWAECERADWMLWLCGKMAGKKGWPTRQQVVLAACACARTSLKFVTKGEKRPLAAIETAERWANGNASIEDARSAAAAAAYAAYATSAADAASASAAYAAYAASASAASAAYAAAAAASVANASPATYAAAATSAAAYAAAANADAAMSGANKNMCKIIRKMLVPGEARDGRADR